MKKEFHNQNRKLYNNFNKILEFSIRSFEGRFDDCLKRESLKNLISRKTLNAVVFSEKNSFFEKLSENRKKLSNRFQRHLH